MRNLLHKKDLTNQAGVKPIIKNAASGTFTKIDPLPVKEVYKPKKRWMWKLSGVVAVTLLLITLFGVIPGYSAYQQSKVFTTSARKLAVTLKEQNLEEAKSQLPETRKQLETTQASWQKVYVLKFLPFLKSYHSDVTHGLNAGNYSLDALEIVIEAIEPYADLLGLKGGSKFVAGSADERIQLAVKTMDKLTPKITELGEKVEKIKKEIDAIDPNRYPEKIGNTIIKSQLVKGKMLAEDTMSLFLNARPLLEVVPQLLGQPTAKRYLVLFQNDKELRATGGFLTAYAIFKIEQGKFVVEKSDDIYELDDQIKQKKSAPPEIATFHKGVYYFNIRDSNLSPDFVESMKQFEELYPGKFDFDGIIAVDTHVLVESIKILGTFVVKGRTFSAEIDKRCDCPKVIYELEDYSTRPVAFVREDRKDVLGELLLQIMKKALGVSPSQYWGQLFQMGLSEIQQKHILAFFKDEKAQKGAESLNMAGRIADGVEVLGYKDGQNWDYLHITDTNFAGAKSNLFVQHFVKVDYAVEGDGTITKTLTLNYKNPAAASDCNLESGGLCLNGLLRNWLRVYVPEGSTLVESKGSQSPKDGSGEDMKTYESLGKTVFEGFVTVRPLGSTEVTFKYKLPFKKGNEKLSTLFQKQPGTEGHEYTILVKGKQKDKFNLTTDKVVTLSL